MYLMRHIGNKKTSYLFEKKHKTHKKNGDIIHGHPVNAFQTRKLQIGNFRLSFLFGKKVKHASIHIP